MAPVKRCQSPISTANPNAVNVDTPRRQPSRRTTAVYSLSAAISVIALSRRSRRSSVSSMASRSASNASWMPRLGEPLPAQPRLVDAGPGYARRSRRCHDAAAVWTADAGTASDHHGHPRGRGPGPERLPGHARHPDLDDLVHPQQPGQMQRIPGVGLDPIPAGRCNFDGAATTHRTPAAVRCRARPNPVGPAS